MKTNINLIINVFYIKNKYKAINTAKYYRYNIFL